MPRHLLRTAALLAALVLPRFAESQVIKLSYGSGLSAGPITGRASVAISRTNESEPQRQSDSFLESAPFFGVDVDAVRPGQAVTFDKYVPGFPLVSLPSLRGDYRVQGMILPHTQFERSDGHTIWVHVDAGEDCASTARPARS